MILFKFSNRRADAIGHVQVKEEPGLVPRSSFVLSVFGKRLGVWALAIDATIPTLVRCGFNVSGGRINPANCLAAAV